jgi:hypothetical protein
MQPLDGAECAKYGLSDKDASWCGAMVDIPASAAVVDFVISDRCACVVAACGFVSQTQTSPACTLASMGLRWAYGLAISLWHRMVCFVHDGMLMGIEAWQHQL